MNYLSNLGLTASPTGDLVRFWRSKVKVTAGCQGGEGIHDEIHFLVFNTNQAHVLQPSARWIERTAGSRLPRSSRTADMLLVTQLKTQLKVKL